MDALSVHRVSRRRARRAPRPNETFVVPALILTVLTRSAAPRRPPSPFRPAEAVSVLSARQGYPRDVQSRSRVRPPELHRPPASEPLPRRPRDLLSSSGQKHLGRHPRRRARPPPQLQTPRASKSRPRRVRRPLLRGFPAPEREKSRPAHTISPTTREQAQAVYSGRSSEANYLGRDTPAPTAYDLPCTATGRQSDASKTSSPTARFTTAERFKTPSEGRGFVRPGPGAHELKGAASVGRQTLSTTASAPTLRCAMGKSTRESRERIYLSRAHEKDAYGRLGPGPVSPNATLRSSLGRQPSSRARDEPSPSFTKSGRWGFADRRAEEPGPGTYNC